jgi:DeoR family fructose operon transcriptional repressor
MEPHMWQEERHRRIRTILAALHSVSTDRIVDELGVSRETVRRDLIELEALGELRRTHGGVVSVNAVGMAAAPAGETRHERAIAKVAVAQLSNGQTLFLDAAAMASHVADALTTLSGLTIITNSFDAAMRLRATAQASAHGNRVLVLGGDVPGPFAATQGEHTVAQIHRYRADAALLFPTGVDARHGATHHDLGSAEVARAMVANSSRVLVLADDTRIGAGARVSYCSAERIGVLCTNRKAQGVEGYDVLAGTVGAVVLA